MVNLNPVISVAKSEDWLGVGLICPLGCEDSELRLKPLEFHLQQINMWFLRSVEQ